MGSAGADIVNRERFRAGRTTDINNLSQFLLEVDKGTFPVADERADNQKPFTGFAFQLECESRVSLKYSFISQNRMPIGTVAFRNHFLFVQVLLGNDLPFLRLVPA